MSELFAPDEILRVFKESYPDVSQSDVEWAWEVPAKIYEASFRGFKSEVHHLIR